MVSKQTEWRRKMGTYHNDKGKTGKQIVDVLSEQADEMWGMDANEVLGMEATPQNILDAARVLLSVLANSENGQELHAVLYHRLSAAADVYEGVYLRDPDGMQEDGFCEGCGMTIYKGDPCARYKYQRDAVMHLQCVEQ